MRVQCFWLKWIPRTSVDHSPSFIKSCSRFKYWAAIIIFVCLYGMIVMSSTVLLTAGILETLSQSGLISGSSPRWFPQLSYLVKPFLRIEYRTREPILWYWYNLFPLMLSCFSLVSHSESDNTVDSLLDRHFKCYINKSIKLQKKIHWV